MKKLKKLTGKERKEFICNNNSYDWETNYDKLLMIRFGDIDFSYDKDNRCNCIDGDKISDLQYAEIEQEMIRLTTEAKLNGMSNKNNIKKVISARCKANTISQKALNKQEKMLENRNLPDKIYAYIKEHYGKRLSYNITTKSIYLDEHKINNIEYNKIQIEIQSAFDNINQKMLKTSSLKTIIYDVANETKFEDKVELDDNNDDTFDILGNVEESHWQDYLKTDDKGNLKHCIFNYVLFLTMHPQFKDRIKMNGFDKVEYLVRYDRAFNDITNKPIDEYEADLIKAQIEKYFGDCQGKYFEPALNIVLLRNSFHPIKDRLKKVEGTWDGIERVKRMIVKYFDCADIPQVHEMTEVMMCGAYQRIIEERPDSGCPFDYMGIIIGKQGAGKTKFFTKLFGETYSILNPDVNNDQAFVDLSNRAWLILFDEMKSIDKADLPTVKSRITETGSTVRLSYGRRSKYYPRHSVFWGNTNIEFILRDDGYERRFLCFESFSKGHEPDWWERNYTDYDIDQIWAETIEIYKRKYAGKIIHISAETEQYNHEVQIRHKIWNDDSKTNLEIESILNYKKFKKPLYFNEDYHSFLIETDEIRGKNDDFLGSFSLKIIKKSWILSRFCRKTAWIDGIVERLGWKILQLEDDLLGSGEFYAAPDLDWEAFKKRYLEEFGSPNDLASNMLESHNHSNEEIIPF